MDHSYKDSFAQEYRDLIDEKHTQAFMKLLLDWNNWSPLSKGRRKIISLKLVIKLHAKPLEKGNSWNLPENLRNVSQLLFSIRSKVTFGMKNDSVINTSLRLHANAFLYSKEIVCILGAIYVRFGLFTFIFINLC